MKLVFAGMLAAAAVAAGPALTHGQLVARADAICVRYEPLLESPPGVDAGLGEPAYDHAWLRIFERQRRELGALRPPARDLAAWTRFLRTLPVVRRRFRALTAAIEAGLPVRSWRPLSARLRAANQSASTAARAAGLRRCFRKGAEPAG
jgi:hypothetical protein